MSDTMTEEKHKKVLNAWRWIDGREPLKRDPLAYDNSKLEWNPPEQGKWVATAWHRWTSSCGRYRVMRVVRSDGETVYGSEYLKYVKFKFDNNGNRLQNGFMNSFWDTVYTEVGYTGYPRYYKSLRLAIESVEHKHQELTKTAVSDTNREEILSKAIRENLEVSKKVYNPTPEKISPLDSTPPIKRTRNVSGDVDRLGSRVGSNEAKINAVLTTSPKKMNVLVSEAQTTTTYYGHLKKLIERGLVAKSDLGYFLVNNG